MEKVGRRAMLGMLSGAAAASLLPFAPARAAVGFTMWRDPGCGCCLEWAKKVEAAFGSAPKVISSADMAGIKRAHGVPAELTSCHTALLNGFVFEGHVPPADIRRLIATRPRGVKGLAVPGMPAGSPGMDVGHDHKQPYKVYAFGPGRRPTIFSSQG